MPVTTAIGFALGVLVMIGFIFSTLSPEWKVSSALDTADHLNNLKTSEGLWMRCTRPDVGEINCDSYETSIIGLDVIVTTMRAMMILSCIAGCAGLGLGLMALDCVHAVKGNTKTWMGRSGGLLMLLGSVLCIAAVSYYAQDTIVEYQQDILIGRNQILFEFGPAIYVGWVAGGFGIIAGCLMGCCLNFQNEDESRDYRYDYQPPNKSKSGGTEYV